MCGNVAVAAALAVPIICLQPLRISGLNKTRRSASVIDPGGRVSPIAIMHDNTERIDNMSAALADQDVLTCPNYIDH